MNKIRYLSLLMLLFSSILLGGKGSSALASPNQRLLEGETLLTVAADPPEGGSVSGGGSYVAGTQVNLRASANTGFQFINWTLDGKVISTENNFTYTKGEVDETLVAHFVYNPGSPSEPSEPVTLSKLIVVANPSDGGSVSGGGNYAKDQKVDLRANPNTGFQFINWTHDGVEVSKERNFTYTKGEDNETLTANFEYKPGNPNEPDEPDIKPIKKKYKLTVVSEEGGTNVSGSGEYESGTQVELYVYVTTGFTFTGWYNEADSLLSSETRFKYTTQERAEILTARFKYTPNNPAEPDEPNLPPKPVSHKITVNAMPSDGGSVSVEKETVNEGEQTRVRASANTGFVFQGWYVADTLFQTAADFYYTMEKKDISMEARFNYSPSAPDEPGEASKKSYTLYLTSVRGLPGRTVQYPVYLSSLDSLTNIQFNISFPIGLTPDIDNIKLSGKAQGYTLSCEEIEVTNDESQIASRRAADKETAYQFTMTDGKLPACNTRLMVIDVKIDETASDTTQQVKINQVTVTDTEGTNTTASTRNGNVVMKESSGDGNYYYLTAISTGSGQVTVNSRTVRNSLHIFDLLEGSSTNVYFTPDNGYHIDKVLLNEEDITEQVVENGRYLFSNVNADATLTVMFAEGASDAYDLTVKAVGNGVVTYNDISIRDSEQMMSVSHGAQVELSITPDEHWHVGQVILNDTTDVTSSVTDGKYIIESMTSAISVSVTFMEDLVVSTPLIARNGNKIGISTATEEAIIYYTLDGTTPDSTSTVYTDSILVDHNCTIKAIALRENYNPSEVAELVVDWFKVANVEFVQEGNHLFLATATEQAVIYYTISNGTAKEQVYSEALTLTEDCVIEAWAVRDGYATSDTTSYEFHAEILTVATPVIVRSGNKIGISTATEEATIYYTLDGTTPDSTSMVYTDSILVEHNCTIKAIALRENYNPSEVAELVVDWFKVANVEFVQEGNHLFLATATEQAVIYYTISNGTAKEQVYSEALTLTEDCVIEAWAVRDGYTTSDTTNYEFHAEILTVATPVIVRNGNKIGISTATEEATIYYTLDGTTPDSSSMVYTDSILVDRNCTIKAIALRENYNPSEVTELVVDWFKVANVEFVQEGNHLFLATATEQAVIYYTISNGTTKEQVYSEALTLTEDCVIEAWAVRDGYATSDTTSYEFHYTPSDIATFDGLVATVSGERTLDDAFESVGGRSVAAKTIAAIIWDKTTKMTEKDLQGLYNPNMLIYISNESLAPAEYGNIVVDGYAKNIVLRDVTSGNNNFYCPKEFIAEIISYTREFRQQTEIGICRGWESITLPFTVQSITNERNGVIAPFGNNDSKKHFWLRKLSENGLIQATQVEANQPYLISMPNNEKAYPTEYNQYGEVTFTSENVVVPVTELSMIETQNENDEIMLCPTMQLVTPSLHVYALNVGEQRGSYLEGSVFEQEYREVRPFEAYTIHHGNSSAPKYLPINDMLGKGSTDINDIIVKKDHLTDDWYSLDGRKLQGRPTQKGLYILNGRKMVVK